MRVHHATWRKIMRRDNWRCAYCQEDLLTSLVTFDAATVDHILPVSSGGTDDEANLVACCSGCNGRLSRSKLTTLDARKAFLVEKRTEALKTLAEWRSDLRA